VISIEMTLRGTSRNEAVRQLRGQQDFAEAGIEGIFGWMCEYPKDFSGRVATTGERQMIGEVRVASDGTLQAAAETLGLGATLATRLRQLLGDQIVVADAEWRDVRELLLDREEQNPYDDPFENEEENRPEDLVFEPPVETPRRNDRCWCGSGKKYKKCHLRQDESH
jgi:hypothetical protein